jgi:hypothetical protein
VASDGGSEDRLRKVLGSKPPAHPAPLFDYDRLEKGGKVIDNWVPYIRCIG